MIYPTFEHSFVFIKFKNIVFKPIISIQNVRKTYQSGDQQIIALDTTTMDVYENELLLIIGPSGSGKTTLLSLMGCVIYPNEGTVWVDGVNLSTLSPKKLARLRLEKIGFVFQQFNLLAPLNVFDNVSIPLKLKGTPSAEITERAKKALETVGMWERKNALPKQLSGGQQQRVAIARALVGNPKIVLCDEPTASLDQTSFEIVMKEIKELANEGKAVAVVTHDPRLLKYADRAVEVKNGKVTELDLKDLKLE